MTDLVERLNAAMDADERDAKKLIARGLLDGCACGCRGDFTARDTLA